MSEDLEQITASLRMQLLRLREVNRQVIFENGRHKADKVRQGKDLKRVHEKLKKTEKVLQRVWKRLDKADSATAWEILNDHLNGEQR